MKDYLVDVAVNLLFFCRCEKTQKVFEKIKEARPSKLYLYQDGPRKDRPDDIENIRKCRAIVEDVDWECEIHKCYLKENQGCDPSGYESKKWMMETEEYGIFLEDDTVPDVSFFQFCKELLEKYKDDERIHMICGYNMLDEYSNSEADYFFSKVGSIWGWAGWKRTVHSWDPTYSWMDDKELLRMFLECFPSKIERRSVLSACKRHRASGKAYFETINASSMMLNSRLAIIPAHNMIANIGIGEEGTHSVETLEKVFPPSRRLFFKETYTYTFPLKDPDYVATDVLYKIHTDRYYGNTVKGRILGKLWLLYIKIFRK